MTRDERAARWNRYLDILIEAHRTLHGDERREALTHLWTDLIEFAAPEHRDEFARRIEQLNALMVGQLNLESWLSFQNGFNSAALDRPAMAPVNTTNTRTQ
jgi:hypothetical protein